MGPLVLPYIVLQACLLVLRGDSGLPLHSGDEGWLSAIDTQVGTALAAAGAAAERHPHKTGKNVTRGTFFFYGKGYKNR